MTQKTQTYGYIRVSSKPLHHSALAEMLNGTEIPKLQR